MLKYRNGISICRFFHFPAPHGHGSALLSMAGYFNGQIFKNNILHEAVLPDAVT